MSSDEILSSITAYHHFIYDKVGTLLSACSSPLQRKKVQDLALDASRLLLKAQKAVTAGEESLAQPVADEAEKAKVLLDGKLSSGEEIDSIITTMQTCSDNLWRVTLRLPGDPVAKPPKKD